MLIALLNFGQPRAYEEVMEENIKHILAAFPSSDIHIYILSLYLSSFLAFGITVESSSQLLAACALRDGVSGKASDS